MYNLRTTMQGSGKRKFILVHATRTTAMPTGAAMRKVGGSLPIFHSTCCLSPQACPSLDVVFFVVFSKHVPVAEDSAALCMHAYCTRGLERIAFTVIIQCIDPLRKRVCSNLLHCTLTGTRHWPLVLCFCPPASLFKCAHVSEDGGIGAPLIQETEKILEMTSEL